MAMNKLIKHCTLFSSLWLAFVFFSSFKEIQNSYSLTVNVEKLRNSKGVVQYIIYDSEVNFPDQDLKSFYKKGKAEIVGNRSTFTFKNLPKGEYAVHILHDENKNGKTDIGFIKPKEGIGFSNYQSIGLNNRPKFEKAKFAVSKNDTVSIKTIYL